MATVGLSLDTFCRGLLRELSADYEVIALSSPDSHLAELGRREGVKTIGVTIKREVSPISDLRSLFKLIKILRRERPDIIHTMTPKAGLLGMLAARISGVPIRIHTFTGLVFPTASGLKRHILKLTDRATCACATHVIPEGEGVRSDLLSHHITRKPLRVLGHGNVRGIDPDYYRLTPELTASAKAIRQNLGIPAESKVLIFIGRFVGDKGLRELLAAFSSLRRSDTHLILVGDIEHGADDLHDTELTGIPDLHLSGGWVDDVRPWLATADILVFPSYREGFPNVVLEAGAFCLPSIVTDINGSREIITDGINGLIVPHHDTDSLRSAIMTLLDSPAEKLAMMGHKARQNVVANFSQRYVRDCLKQFYAGIIHDRFPR